MDTDTVKGTALSAAEVTNPPPAKQNISGAVISGDAPQGASAQILSMVMQASTRPDVDIAKIESLLSIHQGMQDRENEARFDAAMAAARAGVGKIVKNKVNTHSGVEYADMDAVNAALMPALSAHGLSITARPAQAQTNGWIAVSVVIKGHGHTSQPYYMEGPPDGAGSGGKANKTGIQAIGSSYTYLQRYIIRLAFNLSVSNDTDGGEPTHSEDGMPPAYEAKLIDMMVAAGQRLTPILAKYQVERVGQLSVADADELETMLAERITKGEAA